jgi:hypothetical protein
MRAKTLGELVQHRLGEGADDLGTAGGRLLGGPVECVGEVEKGVVVEGMRGEIRACVRLSNKADGVFSGGVLGNGADGGEAQRGEVDHDAGELGKIV